MSELKTLKLKNKVAVVTGGNSGIGLATARLLVSEGATVIVNARTDKRLVESKPLEDEGITVIKADVSKQSDLEKFFKEINERFGQIDVLFANAGIAKFGSLESLPDADIDDMLSINVKGVYFTVKYANPYLNDGASIILTSSMSAHVADAGTVVYAASKAAVRSFARTLSQELSPRNIRVNSISPGPIATPITEKLGLTEEQMQGMLEQIKSNIPMGRVGTVDEIAKAVLFLASDDSSYIMGTDMKIDGGAANM